MRDGRSSRTAAFVALLRALGDRGLTSADGFRDPTARVLLPARWANAFAWLAPKITALSPPAREYFIARIDLLVFRALAIDAELGTALAAGCRQVVILGAGFDGRAYRMDALEGVMSSRSTIRRRSPSSSVRYYRPARSGGTVILGGYVKFGRLRWNQESHSRWTHDSPSTRSVSAQWRFFSTDFARPSLGTFDRTRVPPDVYGKLTGVRRTLGPDGTTTQHPSSLFVAAAMDGPHASHVEGAMRELARIWSVRCLARGQRGWARDASTVLPVPTGLAVTASMQDSVFAPTAGEDVLAAGWEVLVP